MDYTVELDEKQLDAIEMILTQELIHLGVGTVLLIDLAGNIITHLDNGKSKHDVYSLAALAAGNFGAVSEMAKIIGEEDFSLLFHKGEKDSLQFSKVSEDLLLINVFGKDVSLGFLRLKVNEVIKKIAQLTASGTSAR
jgi:predicted regulator of Ras-like GTPase activity (Roadblock/LC7/MglB family)